MLKSPFTNSIFRISRIYIDPFIPKSAVKNSQLSRFMPKTLESYICHIHKNTEEYLIELKCMYVNSGLCILKSLWVFSFFSINFCPQK